MRPNTVENFIILNIVIVFHILTITVYHHLLEFETYREKWVGLLVRIVENQINESNFSSESRCDIKTLGSFSENWISSKITRIRLSDMNDLGRLLSFVNDNKGK